MDLDWCGGWGRESIMLIHVRVWRVTLKVWQRDFSCFLFLVSELLWVFCFWRGGKRFGGVVVDVFIS